VSPVVAAARKGDRISHGSRVEDHDSPALLGVALGARVAARGEGGVTTQAVGAGVACGRGKVTTRDVIPHTTSGAIEDGAPDVLIGAAKLPAALAAAQKVDCHHHRDKPLRTGSESVFAGKLRLARQTDEAGCGAIVCDGDPTVLVGGAPKDGAPPDPLSLVAHGSALASVAIGVATAAGGGAVLAATRWGEALAERAWAAAAEAAGEAEALAGALGADLGALLGAAETAGHALTGAVLGDTLGS
jgi:uncharacterized Zn-binding protein involved in type VI secretion